MDRQTTFLLALGMLIAASFVLSFSGWVLFARDRGLHRSAMRAAAGTGDVHHEAAAEE